MRKTSRQNLYKPTLESKHDFIEINVDRLEKSSWVQEKLLQNPNQRTVDGSNCRFFALYLSRILSKVHKGENQTSQSHAFAKIIRIAITPNSQTNPWTRQTICNRKTSHTHTHTHTTVWWYLSVNSPRSDVSYRQYFTWKCCQARVGAEHQMDSHGKVR